MKRGFFGLALLAALGTGAGSADAGILTFDGPICQLPFDPVLEPCGLNGEIDQSYGDIPGVLDVVYDGDTGLSGLQPVRYWGWDYATLEEVAFSFNIDAALSITFLPAPGYRVTVASFDVAPFRSSQEPTLVQVSDMSGGAILFETGSAPLLSNAVTQYSGPWTSDAGIRILFGPDSNNNAIDNVAFSVSAIPLPMTLPMAAAAFVMLGAIRRLR